MFNKNGVNIARAGLLNPVLECANQNGIYIERYLDQLHIPGEIIVGNGWISRFQGLKFLFDIAQQERLSGLGFLAYEHIELKDLGAIDIALKAAVTFKEVLDVYCRLAPRISQGLDLWVQVKGHQAWLCSRIKEELIGQEYGSQIGLFTIMKLFQEFVGNDWKSTRIHYQYSHNWYRTEAPWFEECFVSYSHKYTSVEFPAVFLSRPNFKSNAFFKKESEIRSEMNDFPNTDESFAQTIQRLIASRFPYSGVPSLMQLAEMIPMSESTIKRWLHREGVTYRGVLDRVRFGVAHQLLLSTQCSIKEIAHELGYSGSNNFIHAFKRITGSTPTKYRIQQGMGLISESE